jgi:hypothetical protein
LAERKPTAQQILQLRMNCKTVFVLQNGASRPAFFQQAPIREEMQNQSGKLALNQAYRLLHK